MRTRRRHTQRFDARAQLAAFVLVSGLAVTATAQEEGVATVEVRFWGYSSNPQFFAYSTKNHLDEEVFFVGQAGSPTPVYSETATEDRSPRDILISREVRDAYGWNSSGHPGTTSQSGWWELSLSESGPSLSVVVRHGRDATPIGSIERLVDPGGREIARYELKEAIWSDDERVVVIILHQELGGEWPVEVDTAYGYAVPERPPEPTPPPPAPAAPAPAQGE